MKKFLDTFKLIGFAAVIAVGTSYAVHAFTLPPSGNPSGVYVSAPLNTGTENQTKGTTSPITGGIFSQNLFASPVAFFTKTYLPGNESTLRIGSDNPALNTNAPKFNSGSAPATVDNNTKLFGVGTIPVTIDLTKRAAPSDAVAFVTDQSCPIATRLINDKAAAFQFWSTARGTNANVIANQVQLTGGNPAKDYVLVGDADGNARWAKASVVNGQVVFTSGTSPVPAGQCAPVVATCPVGQTLQSGQCVCGSGIRAGQVPNTNVQPSAKIITYVNTVNQNPGGSGAPIVPYYAVLHEVRHNGGPGLTCQITALDTACPAFDLTTVNSQPTFTLNGTTYQTAGGNSWKLDYEVGDQCIVGSTAYNIEDYTPPTNPLSWTQVTGSGSVGQTCNAWLTATNQLGTSGIRTHFTPGSNDYSNNCAYLNTSSGYCGAFDANSVIPDSKPVPQCTYINSTLSTQTAR